MNRNQTLSELLIADAAVYVDGRRAQASLAVCGGKIVYVGPRAGAEAWRGPRTEVIEAAGRMVLPGFRDMHIHSAFVGMFHSDCDLRHLTTEAEYIQTLERYARAHPEQSAIRGSGWLSMAFGPRGPHKHALDQIVSDRPVVLASTDGHTAWINSRAIELVRESDALDRDPDTGEPTGVVREIPAIQLIHTLLPPPSPSEIRERTEIFFTKLAHAGVTSIHDAALSDELVDLYARMDRADELPVRVSGAFLCEPGYGAAQVAGLVEQRRDVAGRRFTPRSAKIFLDGVVEAHSAFLSEPYADKPGDCGKSLWERAELEELVRALDHEGFQIHVHSIGDSSTRLALDVFAAARRRNGPRDNRHMIAHLELVSAEDRRRFAELGVIANFQPAWMYRDTHSDRQMEAHLGPARACQRFQMQSIVTAGARVVCGSDWPVGGDFVTLRPLDAIQIGVTRQEIGAPKSAVYMPEERVTLATLLDSYTRQAAFASFQETTTGKLEVGFDADLVLLDRDIFETPAEELSETQVLLTMVEGRTTYRMPT